MVEDADGNAAAGEAGGPAETSAGPGEAGWTPRRRRRRRQDTARPRAVFARLSGEEFDLIVVAAGKAGLTPTGYVAQMAVAVARGEVRPLPAEVGGVVRELVEARTQLRRYGVLLNQAVAKLNATGQVDGPLTAALERCTEAVAGVHGAVARLGRPGAGRGRGRR